MTRKQRMANQIRGEEIDRVPMIGGWNLGVRNLAALAGISVEEYLKDPMNGVVRANQRLDVDACVPPIIPRDINSVRDGQLEEKNFTNVEPEALQERAGKIPDSEEKVLAGFDHAGCYKKYMDYLGGVAKALGDIELVTTVWEATANFALYFQYGYEAFLAATALYPEEVGKIYRQDGLLARERNKQIVRVMQDLDVPPILFTGHDICTNDGPMCSPDFLREHYWQHAKVSLSPFIESGIRVIGHCDGDVMPVIPDMLGAGYSGFQGFQYECGVNPPKIRKLAGAAGEKLLFFTGLSVTRTLPFGTPREVEDDVDYFIDVTAGGRGMFLFTSNVTGVEVPPENIAAAYRHLRQYDPRRGRSGAKHADWPYEVKHPDAAAPRKG